jgi:glycosyltransferase involved in cell wall biosynthesis
MIKLTIIIPVYNGLKTLSITLPFMLKNLHDKNIQVIIVNNFSTDGLQSFLHQINDERVKVINTDKKLQAGESLARGIEQAKGEWIYYIGDDDQIIFNVFNSIKNLLDSEENDIIMGESIRYTWPVNNKYEIYANTFNGDKNVIAGQKIGQDYINRLSINAGGSFIIRKRIYELIKSTYHIYSSPQGVEFFILRAGLLLSKNVIHINLPLFLHGRTDQGWGGELKARSRWNDQMEWIDAFKSRTFWRTKIYTAISYDAACIVAEKYDLYIDEKFWVRQYINEILFTNNKQRLEKNPKIVIMEYLLHISKHTSKMIFIYAVIFILYRYILKKIKITKPYQKIQNPRAGYSFKIVKEGGFSEINKLSKISLENICNLQNFFKIL